MHRPTGVAVAVAVGLTALVAPIWLSINLAWRQSLAAEEARVRYNARDVSRRAEETRNQMLAGINLLKEANLPPCSPAEINLMRQIHLISSYVQDVARIEGDNLICTSLGTVGPIPVGPAVLTSEHGYDERLNVKVPLGNGHPIDIFSRDGFAFTAHPNLAIDTRTQGPDVSIAIFVPSSATHVQITGSGPQLRPEWFHAVAKGGESCFADQGYVICIVRSLEGDFAVVAAAPELYVHRRVARFAFLYVPLGVLCGLALGWAVVYIARRSFSMSTVLRAAARRHEFFVEYQPIVEMDTRRWVGAEALVRWRRPGRVVPPDLFIPVAEETGVIALITNCVAAIVAADLPKFVSIDPDFTVTMNLSAADLRSQATLVTLEDMLRIARARPGNLEIEATERSFLHGEEVRDVIAKIRSMGISVAIDDFGTGYSSLLYLQNLALDIIKIDKAFIETIGTDGATNGVVLHIIDMAHSLNLGLIAEGVETEEQAALLLQRGVRRAQGWLFGKPMPATSLCESLLEARSSGEGGRV
jgi:sensor c-di-GMP phosphodiesterase-like protein